MSADLGLISIDQATARARKAFARHLPRQLARVTDGMGRPLQGRPGDSLTAAVARSLVAAGFELHDCAARAAGGGACLTPWLQDAGVIVSWGTHDVLAHDLERYADQQAVLEVMNYALADVLRSLGYDVHGYGQASAHIVRGVVRLDGADEGTTGNAKASDALRDQTWTTDE